MLRIACHYSKRVIWAASRWVTMRMHPYLWPRVTVAWLFHLWFWSISVTSCYCRLAISSMILIHICDLVLLSLGYFIYDFDPYLWPRVAVAWLFHLWFWSISVTSCYCRLAISSMILIHICDLVLLSLGYFIYDFDPYLWPRVTVAWLFHLWFWSISVTSCYCRLTISSMILLFLTSKVCGNHYLVVSYLSRILDGVNFWRFVLEFCLTCRCLQSSQVKVRAIYYYYCVFLLLFLDS
jgi:hypothetical protein